MTGAGWSPLRCRLASATVGDVTGTWRWRLVSLVGVCAAAALLPATAAVVSHRVAAVDVLRDAVVACELREHEEVRTCVLPSLASLKLSDGAHRTAHTPKLQRFSWVYGTPFGGLGLELVTDLPSCEQGGGGLSDACMQIPPAERQSERVGLLTSHPWGHNFQHFHMEQLPQIHFYYALLQRAYSVVAGGASSDEHNSSEGRRGPALHLLFLNNAGRSGENRTLAEVGPSAFQREAMEMLGIPTNLIRGWPPAQPLLMWRAVWTGMTIATGAASTEVQPFVAETLVQLNVAARAEFERSWEAQAGAGQRRPAAADGELVYASRGGSKRGVANEAELIAALRPLGFRVDDFGNYTLRGRAAMLGRARLVVHPYGAGVVNMVYAPCPHTRWLFICGLYCQWKVPHIYASLMRTAQARIVQANYSSLAQSDEGVRAALVALDGWEGVTSQPYHVDVPQVVRAVQRMLAEQERGKATASSSSSSTKRSSAYATSSEHPSGRMGRHPGCSWSLPGASAKPPPYSSLPTTRAQWRKLWQQQDVPDGDALPGTKEARAAKILREVRGLRRPARGGH